MKVDAASASRDIDVSGWLPDGEHGLRRIDAIRARTREYFNGASIRRGLIIDPVSVRANPFAHRILKAGREGRTGGNHSQPEITTKHLLFWPRVPA